MPKKWPCMMCGKCDECVKGSEHTSIVIKGKRVDYVEEFYECIKCGERFYTKEQLGKTLKNARKAYEDLTND